MDLEPRRLVVRVSACVGRHGRWCVSNDPVYEVPGLTTSCSLPRGGRGREPVGQNLADVWAFCRREEWDIKFAPNS